jgi:hypothetical protein
MFSGEEVSVSLRLRSRTTERPDTPYPCVQQEHHGKEQTEMVPERAISGKMCRNECATRIEGRGRGTTLNQTTSGGVKP